MKIFESTDGTLTKVNAKILYGAFLGLVAYLCWPTNPLWWGFGIITIVLGMEAITQLAGAIKLIFKLRTFEGGQEEFMGRGKQVKSSALASQDFLTEKGVIKNDK